MNGLLVDMNVLAPQQDMDTLVTLANLALYELSDLPPPSLVDRAAARQVAHGRVVLRCAYFFEATSGNITLSRLRAASILLSREFASRNCFSSRTSTTSRPPYCFFQR